MSRKYQLNILTSATNQPKIQHHGGNLYSLFHCQYMYGFDLPPFFICPHCPSLSYL